MATIRLYHGTAHAFEQFDDRYTMRGTEPNSALGIHLTEDPAVAANYALLATRDRNGREPRVLMVDVEVEKVAVVTRREDFLGRPDDLPLEATRGWGEFVEARLDLMDRGYQGIVGDELGDDLIGVWVVFDPSRVRIVGSMDIEDARDLEPALDYADVVMESVVLFDDDGLTTAPWA